MSHDLVNGSVKKEIVQGHEAQVYCQCIVDLISRHQRPYLFKVTVWGQPPHTMRRVYEIAATTEDLAAQSGINQFIKEMSHPLFIFGAMM